MKCHYDECTEKGVLMCSRCKSVRYCSKDHQERHWKEHKKVCRPNDTSKNLSNSAVYGDLNKVPYVLDLPPYNVVPYYLLQDGITPIINLLESFYVYHNSTSFSILDFKRLMYNLIEQSIQSEGVTTAVIWHTEGMDMGLMIQLDQVRVCPPRLLHKSLLAQCVDCSDCVEQLPLFSVFYMILEEDRVAEVCNEALPSVSKVVTSLQNIMAGFRYLKANEERERNFLHSASDNNKGYDDYRSVSYIIPFPGLDESLCSNFGCSRVGTLKCSQCKVALYCSKEHQVEHWKIGGHKSSCGANSSVDIELDVLAAESLIEGRKFIVCLELHTSSDNNPGALIVISDKLRNIVKLSASNESVRSSYMRLYQVITADRFEFDEGRIQSGAYCYAVRESNVLRIFVNQYLKTPFAW